MDTILDDTLTEHTSFPLASRSKRLANYIIDYIMALVLMMLFFTAIAVVSASGAEMLVNEDITILPNLIGIGIFVIYYFLCENLLRGKTIGKYITKTRAVRQDGTTMTAGDVIKRSASRLVPFEPFSFLGGDEARGWHDSWSDTIVVDESK